MSQAAYGFRPNGYRVRALAHAGRTPLGIPLTSLISVEAVALSLYFIRDCMAGFLRYSLDIAHLSFLWFTPDGLALPCFAVFLFRSFISPRNKLGMIVSAYIFFALFMGYIFLDNILGVVSSFKMILPVFVGFSFAGRNLKEYPKLLRFIEVVLYISIVGTIANRFVTYPWTGYVSETFGVTHDAGKLWWDAKTVRLSGLAADSTMAAFFLLLAYVITSVRRSMAWCLAIGAVTILAIQTTTSKTALGMMVLYMVFLVLIRMLNERHKLLALHRLATFSFLAILVPIILMTVFAGSDLARSAKFLFSLQDRIDNSWQKPFVYMADLMPIGYFTGCGLGCFNYPQLLFSNKVNYYVPVDNFYIGTYLMFGPAFVLFMFVVVWKVANSYRDVYKLSVVFVMNIYSITVLNYGPAAALLMISFCFSDVFVNGPPKRPLIEPGVNEPAFKPIGSS